MENPRAQATASRGEALRDLNFLYQLFSGQLI